jgi:hypothetical protein
MKISMLTEKILRQYYWVTGNGLSFPKGTIVRGQDFRIPYQVPKTLTDAQKLGG